MTKYKINNIVGMTINVGCLLLIGWVLIGMLITAFKSTAPGHALSGMILLMLAPDFIKRNFKDLVESYKLYKSLDNSETENN